MRDQDCFSRAQHASHPARLAVLFFAALLFASSTMAQNFTRVSDSANPIAQDLGAAGYNGCAWIDYDNDGDLDLFASRDKLYRNEGNGNFTRIENHGIGAGLVQGLAAGVSWADYDNDGDLDCYYSGARSVLYRNDGNDTFTPITSGEIGLFAENRGWSCAWADYDNDSYVDLMITHPAGFVGAALPNHLLHNDGAGRFTKILNSDVTTGTAPYTVGIWSDYDDDGDNDLFIGTGPVNRTGLDFLYQNQFKESGRATLTRISNGPIAAELRDGQNFNWIDYDNDGDLDCYVTNYSGGSGALVNHMYRNDNGVFTKITTGDIVNDLDTSLGNIWADFDNDGDLDCFVTNEAGSPNRYYDNNGDGTFSRFTGLAMLTKAGSNNNAGATAGDYDNDGDLDLFVNGNGQAYALFRNDSNNGSRWLQIDCRGTLSNRAAIGAKVRALATILGQRVWQRREISAQNGFNSHNSLRVHFGLGDATRIDSLVIVWPSGITEIMTNVAADQILTITEEIPAGALRADFTASQFEGIPPLTVQFEDFSSFDLNAPITTWAWDFDNDGQSDAQQQNPEWTYTEPGQYTVALTVSNGAATHTITRNHFISVLQFSKPALGELATEVSAAQGASWVDHDGDNDLDLFITNAQNQNNALYANNGGAFTKIFEGPLVTDGGASQSASWGDYDGDGKVDLFVANFNQVNFLYHNQGNGVFEKITEGALVTDRELSYGSSWGDIDNDGDLDMFVANVGANNSLYVNAGGGSFAKITEGEIATDRGFSQGCAWGDYDGDGDADLFVANGRNENNFLYANNGDGAFVKITAGEIVNDGGNSRGASWGDYDNDGDLDLFVANEQGQTNFLYNNLGDGTFTKILDGPLVTDIASSFGSSWGDFDNDGDLDLFVANADRPGVLYVNRGDGTFDVFADNPLATDNKTATSATWADYDDDGDLDLLVTANNQTNAFYVNHISGKHWLKIKLIGKLSNTSAIGAKVRVKTLINNKAVWQLREISGQTGFGSQNSLIAHFGLGEASQADSLQVIWPSGRVQTFENFAADRLVTIDEDGNITSVNQQDSGLPLQFTLHQNYPNPFNPATTISFMLAHQTKVTLSIYNVLGEKVATIVDEIKEAGSHAVSWNGRNEKGRLLSSGIYIYTLATDSFVQSRRLLLLK